MARGEIRTKRPGTRRQELLDAALELFVRDGVDGLRVQDITEAAGAAKGTVYRYFPSKYDLLSALRQQFNEEFMAVIQAAVEEAAPTGWAAKIEALVGAAMDFSISNHRVHDVLFHLPAQDGPDGAHGLAEVREIPFLHWLGAFIDEGRARRVFAVADPALTASLLYSAFHGALDREMHTEDFDRDRVFRSLVELFVKSVSPLPAEPRRARRPVGRRV